MALNLERLQKAADRHADHTAAKAHADPEATRRERETVAKRHREIFTPQVEKLSEVVEAARAEAAVTFSGAPPEEVRVLLEGDLLPEIISRDNDLRLMRFLQMAMLVGRSVGRVRVSDGRVTEEGDATGFMVAPGLLMTNQHVLPTSDVAAAAMVVFDDEETIQGEPKQTQTFRLRPDLLFVCDSALDYAIVQVAPRSSGGVPLAQYGFLRLFKQTGKLDPLQREAANIVQHPGGGFKKLAIRDNYFEPVVPDGVDPAKELNSLFYGADTIKGSSGAPVCSDQWYVVGLHRGGVPETRVIDGRRIVVRRDGSPALRGDSSAQIRYITNEGTRVSRIYHSLEEKQPTDTHAAEAAQRMLAVATDPRVGPVDVRTAPLLLPALPADQLGGPEEIIRRSSSKFDGANGYSPSFLGRGRRVPLPRESSEVRRELATLKDSEETELKYDNFSVKMNSTRRTAFFAAVNIDGSLLWQAQGLGRRPRRPQWSYDPRMDEELQPDDQIFSNSMQRGHLYKREDAAWGQDRDSMVRADEHSFTITNATPMIANFNNVEWGDLEDIVTRECEQGHKVSYFAGPIFRSDDPFFNELRANVPAAERRQGMRVPQSFWKIVAWVEDSNLKSAGFILTQRDEIREHGPITEEINFGTYRKRPIAEIERATGLQFPELERVDTFEP
jgi:endonuclease G, mitochondrial